MHEGLMCGAAKRNITPLQEELPGLEALMRKRFGGILDPLYVRAIMIRNGAAQALFVCFELDKAPYAEQYMREISDLYHIPEDSIFFLAVHAHAVPITGDRLYDGPNNIACKPAEIVEGTHRYEARIHDIVMDTVREAVTSLRPATMGVGESKSYINVDRRKRYVWFDENRVQHETLSIGADPERPIDHTVTVVRFDATDGQPIACIVHYPVHCTVMHGNTAVDGRMGISSDIAGKTSVYMEEEYPGAVCMWMSGAAGNINPIASCEVNYPDHDCGGQHQEYLPGNVAGLLRMIAGIHYQDVRKAMQNVQACTGEIAPRHVARLSTCAGKREPYVVRLHMMLLGEITLLSASGELFGSYADKVRQLVNKGSVLVVNHDCSNEYDSGYIMDSETMQVEILDLPGSGERGNIVPEIYEPQFCHDVRAMLQELGVE